VTYPLPNFSTALGGQVAIVTGASAGLGLRFSKVLAAAGAHVALMSRRLDKLEALADEIRASGGVAEPFAVDMTDAEGLDGAVEDVVAKMGLPQILVNNAGIPDAALATRIPLELIDRVLDTNLRAPFVMAREVARRLIKAKLPGRIVNIASSAAYQYDGAGAALYSITKSGMVRMTEVLAVEWAKFNINVTGIAPGGFRTEMMDGMIERVGEGMIEQFPRKRIGDPAQMDSTLLFLVSLSSECVTGTTIRIDDGQGYR